MAKKKKKGLIALWLKTKNDTYGNMQCLAEHLRSLALSETET